MGSAGHWLVGSGSSPGWTSPGSLAWGGPVLASGTCWALLQTLKEWAVVFVSSETIASSRSIHLPIISNNTVKDRAPAQVSVLVTSVSGGLLGMTTLPPSDEETEAQRSPRAASHEGRTYARHSSLRLCPVAASGSASSHLEGEKHLPSPQAPRFIAGEAQHWNVSLGPSWPVGSTLLTMDCGL